MTSCWDCMCKKCAFSAAVHHKPTNSLQRYCCLPAKTRPAFPSPRCANIERRKFFGAASLMLSNATEGRTIKLLIHFNYLCCLKSFFPDAAWNFSAAWTLKFSTTNFKFPQRTMNVVQLSVQSWKNGYLFWVKLL